MTTQPHCSVYAPLGVPHSRLHQNRAGTLARLVFAVLACVGSPAWSQTVPLGTAVDYAVLAGSAVTNTGPSVIAGDLGISPNNASSVTGFPPGVVSGMTNFANAAALQAQNDLTIAYNNAAGRTCGTTIAADLGGSTLVSGVYCSATSMGLTGTLTLDAQGNPNAVFVFQAGSTLTTASNATVNIINGGQQCNVFWQVGSSATLGTTTTFIGSILAFSSITLNTGANVSGRILARNGAVTLDDNDVTVCTLAGGTNVALSKAFNPTTINVDGVSTLTVTLDNPNPTIATLTAPLVDTLPVGVLIAPLPNAATTCGGAVVPVAVAGGTTLTLPAGATIPANSNCTLSVNVTSAQIGTYINTLPIGALVTSNGSNPAPAVATLIVVGGAVIAIPTLSTKAMMVLAALFLALFALARTRRLRML